MFSLPHMYCFLSLDAKKPNKKPQTTKPTPKLPPPPPPPPAQIQAVDLLCFFSCQTKWGFPCNLLLNVHF